MKDVIVKRCCGNCEWSISPKLEEEIMKENHYEEDDPTRPRAGDCCLGMEHNGDYICINHEYLSVGIDTYAFYDDMQLGQGYYVISEYYNNIIRYFKLYRYGNYDQYNYGIRAYEINPINKDRTRTIAFEFGSSNSDNVILHKVFSIFANALGDNVIINEENNNEIMKTEIYKYGVAINFVKSINNKENSNDFIDIKIKCNKKDRNYRIIEHLFRNLAVATNNMKDTNSLKKVRQI